MESLQQCNNESEECAEDLRPSPKNTPHGRTHRAQAPSMLFRKAFNDIIGKPVRSKLPSKTESNSLQEIKSVEESNWPILEEPVPVTHTAEKRYSSETVRESSSGKKVNDEPSYQSLNSSRIITDRLPELVTDYDQVDTGRLVFLYEDESDKDVGTEEDLAKDPSIGSDFSDLEDVGSLARFSQEDLTSCCAKGEDICTTGSGYVMYQSSWCNYTEPAGSSPVYRPSTEQNTWHQEESNSRHISDHSVNAVENSVLSVSSDSDSTGSRRRERSDSFDIPWTYENTTKMVRRRSETRCPTDFSRSPKFLEDGFIDTHCHLDMLFSKLLFRGSFADFRNDYNTTFPREFQGCITDFCNPGTLQDRLWERLMGEDMVWGAFGCHPHFAQYYTDEKQEWIMNALRHPKAVAYGEMGLDYSHKCSTLIPVQHQVFEKQLKLAVSLGKPLVIHCRDADEDLFEIMKRLVPWDYKIHRHCFTGSYRQIEPFLKEFPNMAVGFTALLTYSSALEAQDAMRQIPLERLIVETDAPYFLPRKVPKSMCKFAHPGHALHTVQEMAKLRNMSLKSVLAALLQNTNRLYNL
ncbi:putative deoxyribonuclease TATDN2 [Rhinophrynus dorsalis]